MCSFYVIAEEKGGSPIPVLKRALQRGKREDFDVVIVDTCGRLANNYDLVEELKVRFLRYINYFKLTKEP